MIVGVHLLQYELPFRSPLRAGDGVHESRSGLLLGLVDDSGITGWGEAAPLPGWSGDMFPQVEAALRGLAATIKERPRQPENLLPTAVAWLVRLPSAAAALDSALVDLAAQSAGRSVAEHLAGKRDAARSVAVNALIAGESASEVAGAAATATAEGFTAFKLKLGGRPLEQDVARVAALRDVIGPGASLRLDAGGSWTPGEATQILRDLVPYDIEYIEDPVADLDSFVQVGAATEIPLAADALVARSPDPLGVVSTALADVFVLKPGALGGLSVATTVARRAHDRGRKVVVTSFLESAIGLTAAVHLAAALPATDLASGLATSYLFTENVAEPPPIVSGMIQVPAGPGLGVAPSEVGSPDLAEGGAG
jgi:o-succinylbenzoate synthase